MPVRVPHMDVTGTMQFNLDTRETLNLHVESVPRFVDPEDARAFKIVFADTSSLKASRN